MLAVNRPGASTGGARGRRVLVCGGRDFDDHLYLREVLDGLAAEPGGVACIIHGNARGADSLAHQWAVSRGIGGWACPANWKRDGKRAGPMRNQRMLGHKPDLVVAFPGGTGTADMVKRAEKAGVSVMRVGHHPDWEGVRA